jgi:hypothetical protein
MPETIPLKAYVSLPMRHSQMVGKIVVKHAFIERYLITIVYGLAGLDREMGDLIVRNPRTNQIVTMIEDICDHKNIEIEKSSFRQLKKELENLKSIRDNLAHNTWVDHPDHSDPIMVSTRGSWDQKTKQEHGIKGKRVFNPAGQPVTRKFLGEVDKACDNMIEELAKLMIQFGLDT